MNDEQLIKKLIKQGESEQLEFMEAVQKENIAKTLSGFLNGSGGRVIIGISDAGKTIGLEDIEKIEQELKEFLLMSIIPDSPITFSIENIVEKQVLVIKVWGGSKQPYIFDGGIFYRRCALTQKASSKEISKLIHERQEAEQHWERQIVLGVELSDLDKKLISATINESRKNHRSSIEGDDILEFLIHYGLYINGSFTNACIVLFAKKSN